MIGQLRTQKHLNSLYTGHHTCLSLYSTLHAKTSGETRIKNGGTRARLKREGRKLRHEGLYLHHVFEDTLLVVDEMLN